MHILNAAQKYQIDSLKTLCIKFLENQLDANNVYTILEHCRFFHETHLAEKCLKLIEKNTKDVFTSSEFMSVSAETLSYILDSDKLSMKEVDIFLKCFKWATARCENKRSVRKELGDILFKIRFPTMTSSEFADKVCPKGVLTKEEQLDILRYISSERKDKRPEGFICNSRNSGK